MAGEAKLGIANEETGYRRSLKLLAVEACTQAQTSPLLRAFQLIKKKHHSPKQVRADNQKYENAGSLHPPNSAEKESPRLAPKKPA